MKKENLYEFFNNIFKYKFLEIVGVLDER
jgi:hypothetical protein